MSGPVSLSLRRHVRWMFEVVEGVRRWVLVTYADGQFVTVLYGIMQVVVARMRVLRGWSGSIAPSPGCPHEPPAGRAPHTARGDGDGKRVGANPRTRGRRRHGSLALHRAQGERAGSVAGCRSAPRGARASAARQDRATAHGRHGAGGALEHAWRCRRCLARPRGRARPADRSRRRRALARGLRQRADPEGGPAPQP